MSNSLDKLVSVLQKSLLETEDRKPKPYDTPAEVRRIEGSVAYVHIPGGVDETPVKLTSSADVGDEILVRVANGSAWGIGNSTNPPTDDRVAIKAQTTADGASKLAGEAFNSANAAKMAADYATEQAEIAGAAATRATESASAAGVAANEAKTSANEAKADASEAKTSATQAKEDARQANEAANNALTGLSTVESVVDTLSWLTEHSTPTEDTVAIPDKNYFIKNQDRTFTRVSDPVGKNPTEEHWYEMDEAVSNYVAAHLALTNYGLNLTLDDTSYRIHIGTLTSSGDDGVYIIDENGNVVTYFGESISFDSSYPFHIGNQNNYILWNPTQNRIEIGGDVMMGGTKTLDEVLAELDGNIVFDTTYTVDTQNNQKIAHFTAHVYRGGVDIAQTNYTASEFSWALKRELTAEEAVLYPEGFIPLGTGYTKDVDITTCGYGAEVIAKFTPANDSEALDNSGNNLTNANNEPLTVRSTGDSVRVRDLTVSTTIYPTDKLMMVGAEDEHLVTMQTLQDYLNVNLNKQVLFNTTAAWDAQVQLQSQANTLYIYTDHQVDSEGNVIAGIKVGDGNAYLIDMPFTDSAIMEHISDNVRHISAEERVFWNNKVSCYLADNDRIIFTTA